MTKAHQSIAQFKLREGPGDRLPRHAARRPHVGVRRPAATTALPRIRDFRGLNGNQFDGNGNYTFGLNEQVMFHEIDQDKIDRLRGMDITFVTTATNDREGRALLKHLGFPFKAVDDAKAQRGVKIQFKSKSAAKAAAKRK